MKRVVFLFLSAIMVFGIIEAKTTKKSGGSKKKSTSSMVVKNGETKTYYDYLTTQKFELKKGTDNELKIEYPISGSDVLINKIRQYIANSLDENYSGALETPDALMKAVMKDKRSAKFDMDGEALDEDIVVEYATERIITYEFVGYVYMGGAHGWGFTDGYTFLVENGDVFNVGMLPSITKMRPYILEGLAKYWDTNVGSLEDEMDVNPADIEYPQTIFITGEGINFVYGEEDIAPHYAGIPRAIVPATQEVINMLTPAGQAFFK